MKRRPALVAMIFFTAVAVAQAEPATATLKGHVFATTRNGETKPARLARVYLASGSAQITLQRGLDRALTQRLEDLKNNADVQQACLLASVSIFEAARNTPSIQTANTDESGAFDLPNLPAGTYTVVVIGTANGYQSVWHLTTAVAAGKRQKVTLPEPALECQ